MKKLLRPLLGRLQGKNVLARFLRKKGIVVLYAAATKAILRNLDSKFHFELVIAGPRTVIAEFQLEACE